jgi:hypothetical protein
MPLAKASAAPLCAAHLLFTCILCGLLAGGCTTAKDTRANFLHDFPAGPTPWLHEDFDNAPDRFSFAIVSDLTGGEREGIFDIAVAQLNLLRPEFVISVGDLIEGETDDPPLLRQEWEVFDGRANKLDAPFFHVGGNHDLTGFPLRQVWEERFGRRYYWFRYGDALFLVMDSEDHSEAKMAEMFEARSEAIRLFDAGRDREARASKYMNMPERMTGWIGREQVDYFLEVLRANEDVRWTFLFMHKPAWMRDGAKPFDAVEAALQDRPYTYFNGHFHSYSHTERFGRDYMILGTTGGSQNATNEDAFDHITLVTVDDRGPAIATLRLDGILDKTGRLPLDGEARCFQASRCKGNE